MKPALDPREWVFCCVDRSFPLQEAKPIFVFNEWEGMTVVIERSAADARGLEYAFPSRRIILRVHSDLEAVGFLAAVTTALAKHAISANVVSAFYHDHLFVPLDRADEALRILEEVSAEAARRVL